MNKLFITRIMICYLQGVWWLLLSVQWFQSIQKLSVHSEYPLIISCNHQVGVVSWQAMELRIPEQNHKTSLCVPVQTQTVWQPQDVGDWISTCIQTGLNRLKSRGNSQCQCFVLTPSISIWPAGNETKHSALAAVFGSGLLGFPHDVKIYLHLKLHRTDT